MKALATVIATALITLATQPVEAGSGAVHEYKFGVLAHDVPHLWSGFRREGGMAVNAEAIFSPSVAFMYGTIRPAAGVTLTVQDDGRFDTSTSKVYAGARWVYESPRGWFAGIGLGAAVHNGKLDLVDVDRKALGSRVLFHIPFEIGLRFEHHHSLSLYFDHVSNAGTRSTNEGLDSLGMRYGFRY